MGEKDEITEDGLEKMEEILGRAEVGRIALCDSSMPYIIPVNFLYDNKKIAFHCAWEGRKLDIISTNPNCCFEVDEYMGEVGYHNKAQCHLDYDSVLAYGKARIESDADEKTRLLQLFSKKYSEIYRKPPSKGGKRFDTSQVSECCCVIIDVKMLTGRRERTVKDKRKKITWRHNF